LAAFGNFTPDSLIAGTLREIIASLPFAATI